MRTTCGTATAGRARARTTRPTAASKSSQPTLGSARCMAAPSRRCSQMRCAPRSRELASPDRAHPCAPVCCTLHSFDAASAGSRGVSLASFTNGAQLSSAAALPQLPRLMMPHTATLQANSARCVTARQCALRTCATSKNSCSSHPQLNIICQSSSFIGFNVTCCIQAGSRGSRESKRWPLPGGVRARVRSQVWGSARRWRHPPQLLPR
jgi:hypothetical protein